MYTANRHFNKARNHGEKDEHRLAVGITQEPALYHWRSDMREDAFDKSVRENYFPYSDEAQTYPNA